MIKRIGERSLETKFGTFAEILYYDGQWESIAPVMGDIAPVVMWLYASILTA